MKNEIKNYTKYFIHQNIKYIILEFIILFLILPFMLYVLSIGMNDQSYSYQRLISKFAESMLFCITVLSVITPIIVYRFLFKRKHCDLYFSLPIERKELFKVQYFIGLIIALIPFTINVIFAAIVCSLHYVQQTINPIFPFILLLYVLFFALYSFMTFIISKCNTVLDSVIVSIGFIFIPVALNIALQSFLTSQINNIFTSVAIGAEAYNISNVISFISPILSGGNLHTQYLMHISYDSFKILILPIIYWSIFGIVLIYCARKSFIARKEEECEQKTTSKITYPLLITLLSLTVILGTFKTNYLTLGMLFNVVIVFLLYAVLTFIQERKICIKWRGLLFFVLVYAVSIGFTICFQNSEGFGLIHEIPNKSDIKIVQVSVRMKSDEEETSYEYDAHGNPYYTLDRMLFEKDQVQHLISLQEDLVEIGKESGPIVYQDSDYINLRFTLKNGESVSRSYPIYNSSVKEIADQIVIWLD